MGFFSTSIPSESDFNAFQCYLGKVAELDGTRMDGSQDSYFYNFNGNSGRYVYANKKRTSDQDLPALAAVTLPYKPIKIQGTTFTDVDGTVYTFGGSVNGTESTERSLYTGDVSYNFTSTWYLSQVVSANRMDTILIDYTAAVNVTIPPLWSTTLIKKVTQNGITSYSYQRGLAPTTIFSVYPANIYFKNGKVSFTYTADRLDVPEAKRLTGIYIYKKEMSGSYTEIKHFELGHSYFTCTDGYTQADASTVATHTGSKLLKRLRLDSVTEKSPLGSSLPAHQFTYYEDIALPIYGSYAQDLWGFYNGASSNTKLLLWDSVAGTEPSATYGANRLPSFAHAVAGALKEVKYPVGGKTVFEYEAHKSAAGIDGGGIRIKSISNLEGSRQLTKKAYSYPVAYITNNISTGNMSGLAYQFSLREEELNNCATPNTNTYTSFPESYNFMLGSNSGSSMAYGTVEVVQTGEETNTNGKTVNIFSQATDVTSSMFPFMSISNEWRRGQLLEEKQFNASGGLVKETKSFYKTVLTDSLMQGIGARTTFKPLIGVFSPGGNGCTYIAYSYCPVNDHSGNFTSTYRHQWRYQLLNYQIGTVFLDSTVTNIYSETGSNPIHEKSAFTYATATHHQILRQTSTDSRNLTRETLYKYPHELAGSHADYQEMVNRHIYTPVTEQQEQVGGVFTKLVKTNYKKWYPSANFGGVQGFFAPLSVEVQLTGGVLVPEIVFGEKADNPSENGYDTQGHPVVYTTRDGTVTRLNWWQENGKRDLVRVQTINNFFTTTFDYNALVGTKSVTDPDGKLLYYEYDAFGRLKTIRDNHASGPVRKSFCYNYQRQAISCDAIATTGVLTATTLFLLPEIASPPLPVTLVNFNVRAEGNTALLNWNTTSETNSERFDVEHSLDGKQWVRIGTVNAKGSSSSFLYYAFSDGTPEPGENLYRLKMVDSDASFAYSRIESVRFEDQMVLYPNPLVFGQTLHMTRVDISKISSVKIYDQGGNVRYNGKPENGQIDTSGIPSGAYLFQITATNGIVRTYRIIKQ